MNGNDLMVLAFGITNSLRLLSYLPQIRRVACDRGGAQAISCLTWNLWVAANASTALYAWTHLHDLPLALMHAGNALCCACVVAITCCKRAGLRGATQRLPLPEGSLS
jgi:hypothetical protein